jgi:hypothetical protein
VAPDYDIFDLAAIDLARLELVKETYGWIDGQDHSRWVLRNTPEDRQKTLYFKIWNPTHIRRDNLVAGLQAGFYTRETVPAFKGLIYHKGFCRGYVMEAAEPSWTQRFDENFYARIKEASRRTHWFNPQIAPPHILKYGKTYTLIDLEGVFHLDDFPRLAQQHSFFDFPDYEQWIVSLCNSASTGVVRVEPYSRNCGYRQFTHRPASLRIGQYLFEKALRACRRKREHHLHRLER